MNSPFEKPQDLCLKPEELQQFIASVPRDKKTIRLERHLAECASCRQELAELVEILHPDPGTEDLQLSPFEIAGTVAAIREVAHEEAGRRKVPAFWTRWAAVAAAAVILLASGAWGFKYFYEKTRSEEFYAQAKSSLESSYAGESPGGLRLDLPFRSTAGSRNAPDGGLVQAENLFYQALAVRDDFAEAHLGLGAVYLSTSRFAEARRQFQKVLDVSSGRIQALLGRGVAEFEEARARRAEDPMERTRLLEAALGDFDHVLSRDPGSEEALYDRILTLIEIGSREKALEGIERYLLSDRDSIWAAKLRELKARITLMEPRAYHKAVDRAAAEHSGEALDSLAGSAPARVPAAIRYALKRGFDLEDAADLVPGPENYRWAAEILEQKYRNVTGDGSYAALLRFYAGLSPPQRKAKKALDTRFQKLVESYQQGDIASALAGSDTLESRFSELHDVWQQFRLRHLRGNCFYYQADFKRAEVEYGRMLELADRIGAFDLKATALGALSSAYNEQPLPDRALETLTRLKDLAGRHHLDNWLAFASRGLGSVYLKLNRFQDSLREQTTALKYGYAVPDGTFVSSAMENMGNLMERMGRLRESEALYREALAHLPEQPEKGSASASEIRSRRLNLIVKRGDLALVLGDNAGAEDLFRRSLASCPEEMRELRCRAQLGLAETRIRENDTAAAAPLLRDSLNVARKNHFAALIWKAQFLQGRLLEREGKNDRALVRFRQSVDSLERLRNRIPSGELRRSFLTGRFDPYREIVSILVHSSADADKTLEYVDRAKSMTLLEYLRDRRLGSGNIRKAGGGGPLAPGLIGLEYFLSPEELFVFVTRSSGSKAFVLPVSAGRLKQQVGALLESVEKNEPQAFERSARALYDEIMAPVLPPGGMTDATELAIFPDGPLHLLPFGALEDSKGRFLIERYSLSYAPSESVMRYCLALDRGNAGGSGRGALFLDGSASLKGAGEELAGLSRIYGNHGRILGAGDLVEAPAAASASEIIHFAGHSRFVDGKPALLLKGGPHPVYLDSSAIAAMQLGRNRLVTLAGCNTGIGPGSDGEPPWGLVPAFLEAGAPALIVSLLPVDDSATQNLILQFYDLLAQGNVPKAEALRRAQLSVLSSNRASGVVKPLAWAPYVLIGDPR